MARHTKFKLLSKLIDICIGPLVHGRLFIWFQKLIKTKIVETGIFLCLV